MIKSIKDITSIDNLGLSKRYQKLLSDYDPKDIIIAARQHDLTNYKGIGQVRAAKITEELQASGYIHTESSQSLGLRRLLANIGIITSYNSTEEYEAREEFTPERISTVRDAITATLTPREGEILILRFGLSGNPPLGLDECGNQFYVTRERIRQIEAKTLRKLHHPSRARMVRKFFPEFPDLAPKPTEYHSDNPVDKITIEDLDLSIRAYNCLKRANIDYLGQLRQLSQSDLRKIRNLGDRPATEVLGKLAMLGITLAE